MKVREILKKWAEGELEPNQVVAAEGFIGAEHVDRKCYLFEDFEHSYDWDRGAAIYIHGDIDDLFDGHDERIGSKWICCGEAEVIGVLAVPESGPSRIAMIDIASLGIDDPVRGMECSKLGKGRVPLDPDGPAVCDNQPREGVESAVKKWQTGELKPGDVIELTDKLSSRDGACWLVPMDAMPDRGEFTQAIEIREKLEDLLAGIPPIPRRWDGSFVVDYSGVKGTLAPSDSPLYRLSVVDVEWFFVWHDEWFCGSDIRKRHRPPLRM